MINLLLFESTALLSNIFESFLFTDIWMHVTGYLNNFED